MNNKYKILLVEDEGNIRNMLSAMLETGSYRPIAAETGATGLMMTASHQPDLIILDLGLPDLDGMDFLRAVRQESSVPIIVLSARSGEHDKVAALDAGANDYVTKPFGTAELMARVRSALRNARTHSSIHSVFTLQEMTLNFDSRQVFLKGNEIKLTQTEYNILALLAENCGKMMSYSAIIKAVWGYPDDGSTKRLQVNMANLRRKLGIRPGDSSYIINEVGVGYRMNNEIES